MVLFAALLDETNIRTIEASKENDCHTEKLRQPGRRKTTKDVVVERFREIKLAEQE